MNSIVVQKYFDPSIILDGNETKDNFHITIAKSKAKIRGWDSGPEKHYLTLERKDSNTSWGFSCSGGLDLEHWGALFSGVSARRHEKGLWLNVASVRDETAAKTSGLKSGDFITSINGRIVFHLSPEDVSRLIRNSGNTLYLDIERNNSKNLLYCNGLHQFSYNFLYDDNFEMKKPHF